MSDTEASDSDRDSLSSMGGYETREDGDEDIQMPTVRNAVRDWKVREFNKTTTETANPKGLQLLRDYAANAARLYYDIQTYLKTSKNKEQNMKDSLYVNIISAIGVPGSLSFPLKTLIENSLQRDLLELPYTIEPKTVNSYAKDGMVAQQQFPEEE